MRIAKRVVRENIVGEVIMMSSISVGELKTILDGFPDDYEVIMSIHHQYPISVESGIKGWIAYINGVEWDDVVGEVRLMN